MSDNTNNNQEQNIPITPEPQPQVIDKPLSRYVEDGINPSKK